LLRRINDVRIIAKINVMSKGLKKRPFTNPEKRKKNRDVTKSHGSMVLFISRLYVMPHPLDRTLFCLRGAASQL
jgi:hypothetical protein